MIAVWLSDTVTEFRQGDSPPDVVATSALAPPPPLSHHPLMFGPVTPLTFLLFLHPIHLFGLVSHLCRFPLSLCCCKTFCPAHCDTTFCHWPSTRSQCYSEFGPPRLTRFLEMPLTSVCSHCDCHDQRWPFFFLGEGREGGVDGNAETGVQKQQSHYLIQRTQIHAAGPSR